MTDVRTKLAATMGPVLWDDLRTHAQRDAMVVARAPLDLLEVAVAVAADDTARVSRWIAAGTLARPTAADLERWEAGAPVRFVAVVVAPFVLVRVEPIAPDELAD